MVYTKFPEIVVYTSFVSQPANWQIIRTTKRRCPQGCDLQDPLIQFTVNRASLTSIMSRISGHDSRS